MVVKLDWQGQVGKEWAIRADGLNQLLGPVGQAGIKALGDVAGKRVLDVGCGAGSTSRALSALGADVTGVDVSSDLLELAKENKTERYILADASRDTLGGPYDAVYSRFGAMFFDDPTAGWVHIRAQSGAGCKLSIVSWCDANDNGWASIPMMAARPILGPEKTQMAPSTVPGPFAWADPEYFGNILRSAGWQNLQWKAVDRLAEITTGDNPDPVERAVLFSLRIGILARHMAGVSDEIREQVAAALRLAYQDYLVGNAVRVPTKAWIITGTS